jgi:hypothetical protein
LLKKARRNSDNENNGEDLDGELDAIFGNEPVEKDNGMYYEENIGEKP